MKQYINIPEELRKLNRWVCWTMEERNGKPTKVPKNPNTGNNAMSNEPDTWGSFKQAVDRMKKDKTLLGIGFQFEGSGYAGFDIDGCRDKETGELTPEAQDIITTLDSYTEVSASGKGVHVICRGTVPDGRSRNGKYELYFKGRYFIMTGELIDEKSTIHECTEQLAIVHEKYINVQKTKKNVSKTTEIVTSLNENEIVKKAMAAKNGDLFSDMMNGNWQNRYSSQSEADISLCNLLAFWTGKDADKIDRIFRQSSLFRDKWDEARPGGTYGIITIQNSIDNCNTVYTPRKESKPKKEVSDLPESYDYGYDEGFDQLVKSYASVEPEKKNFSQDDIGNAERLVDKFGKTIRYCFTFKSWFIWDINKWRIDTKGSIFEMARQTARGIIQEAFSAPEEKRDGLLRHARQSCNSKNLDAMIKQARSLPSIPVDATEFDLNNWNFAVKNGTINLKTGKIKDHDSKDLITKISNIEYDPNAKAPTWQKYLEKIFNNDIELINFIQRAVGYSLTGETTEQCFFMCHGTGSNGKSTLFNVISDVLGDCARTADMDIFTERRGNQNIANEVAMLQGSRLVTTVETNDSVKLNEALVKKLTGSDIIVAKRLYADPFEYKPIFKIWMAVNHLPIIRGTDIGIWRRVRLIPFNVHITDAEKDVKLPEKLKVEYPGILKWAIEGCLEWQKQGLNPPSVVLTATNDYKEDQDLFADFINTCCVINETISTSSQQLYNCYENWCTLSNYKPLSSKRFVAAMREKGFIQQITRSRKYIWVGIGIAVGEEDGEAFNDKFWER